jgi:nucleoside phosphorylase
MGNYNVVLALLPHMGKVNAAGAAASMRGSYSNLRLALLVGVCGAAPYSRKDEILLGDVIISKTVVQHDFGRQYADRFIRKETTGDSLGRANKDVRNLVAIFETDRGNDWLKDRTAYFLEQLQDSAARASRQGKYDHPGLAKDRLYKTQYRHKHHNSKSCLCHSHSSDTDPVCDKALELSCADLGCDEKHVVERARLRVLKHHFKCSDKTLTAPPAVHVGAVASGDGVIKSAAYRDMMSKDAGVIAFEMEGAGIWDEVPSIVVKGVCDYADSHKNKDWQDYAAATAASACKAILEKYIRTDKVIGG